MYTSTNVYLCFVLVHIGFLPFGSTAHMELDYKEWNKATGNEYPEEWVDPHEMFVSTPKAKKGAESAISTSYNIPPEDEELSSETLDIIKETSKTRNAECSCPNQVCVQSKSDIIFLQRLVGYFLSRFLEVGISSDDAIFDVVFELKKADFGMFTNFVSDSSSVHNINDVVEKFEHTITSVKLHQLDPYINSNNFAERFEKYFKIDISNAAILLFIAFLIIVCISLEVISSVSWGTQVKRLFFLAILISFPWTFFHEYKLALAEHQSISISIPKHCTSLTEETGYIHSLTHYVGSVYQHYFSTAKDPCLEYHEKFLIDPIVKVPPTKVMAVTLTKLLLEPLSHFGTTFSITFKNMFSELPVQLWIPAFVFIFVLMVVVVLLTSVVLGYSWSLNLPFWTGFQISPALTAIEQPSQVQALLDSSNEIINLKQQLKELHAVLENKTKPLEISNFKNNSHDEELKAMKLSLRQRALSAPTVSPEKDNDTHSNLPYPHDVQSPLPTYYDWNKIDRDYKSLSHCENCDCSESNSPALPYPSEHGDSFCNSDSLSARKEHSCKVLENIGRGDSIEKNIGKKISLFNQAQSCSNAAGCVSSCCNSNSYGTVKNQAVTSEIGLSKNNAVNNQFLTEYTSDKG